METKVQSLPYSNNENDTVLLNNVREVSKLLLSRISCLFNYIFTWSRTFASPAFMRDASFPSSLNVPTASLDTVLFLFFSYFVSVLSLRLSSQHSATVPRYAYSIYLYVMPSIWIIAKWVNTTFRYIQTYTYTEVL
jgi:hypothetical protein